MAQTQILITKTGSFNIADILKEIENEKPKFPSTLGNEAVRMFKSGFDTGGGITDLSVGGWKSHKDSPLRSNRSWKVLNNTGALKNSIRVNLRSKSRSQWSDIVLVSNLPYSRLQNFGTMNEVQGESVPTIHQIVTDNQRAFFKAMGRVNKDDIWYKMSGSNRLDINVPARPFLWHSKKVNDRMIEMIIKKFDRIMKTKSSNP